MFASPELPVTLTVALDDIGTGCTACGRCVPRDRPPTAKSRDMGANGEADIEAGLQTPVDDRSALGSPGAARA